MPKSSSLNVRTVVWSCACFLRCYFVISLKKIFFRPKNIFRAKKNFSGPKNFFSPKNNFARNKSISREIFSQRAKLMATLPPTCYLGTYLCLGYYRWCVIGRPIVTGQPFQKIPSSLRKARGSNQCIIKTTP